jgi:hypothetical protein
MCGTIASRRCRWPGIPAFRRVEDANRKGPAAARPVADLVRQPGIGQGHPHVRVAGEDPYPPIVRHSYRQELPAALHPPVPDQRRQHRPAQRSHLSKRLAAGRWPAIMQPPVQRSVTPVSERRRFREVDRFTKANVLVSLPDGEMAVRRDWPEPGRVLNLRSRVDRARQVAWSPVAEASGTAAA